MLQINKMQSWNYVIQLKCMFVNVECNKDKEQI